MKNIKSNLFSANLTNVANSVHDDVWYSVWDNVKDNVSVVVETQNLLILLTHLRFYTK